MKTFRLFLPVAFIFFLFAIVSCQKGGGGGTSTPEASLVVVTSPLANGHVEAPAPGPSFPLKVTITSTMPSKGVKIDVTAKPDGGTVAFFTASVTSTTAVNDFAITGATSSVVAVVDITVTSIATPSNKWTGSYKFSKK